MKRLFVFTFLAFSLQLSAAPMVRVISIKDARTIVVDNRGIANEVSLSQVVIPPNDEEAATAYLRQSLTNSWVMIESDARGGSFVYRSPDALFINGELSRRAYATLGDHMTYLGELSPGPQRKEAAPAKTTAKTPVPRIVHRYHRRR